MYESFCNERQSKDYGGVINSGDASSFVSTFSVCFSMANSGASKVPEWTFIGGILRLMLAAVQQ